MKFFFVRLTVVLGLLILIATVCPSLSGQSPRPDYTFHLTLRSPATLTDHWQLSGTPADIVNMNRPGPIIVNGDLLGQLGAVVNWTPALNQLTLGLNFRNVGNADATSSTLVIDMISPAWDPTLSISGGFVLGTSTVPSNGSLFDEHFPAGPIPRSSVTTVSVGIGIGNPGALPAPRYDIYYHIETGSGSSIVRHGLPFEGTLPHTMAKLVPPPLGNRYLALDIISQLIQPVRWGNRFQSKYNLHPAIYQFIGAAQAMDVQTVDSYVASIQLAAARGMVPAVQMNVGTVTDKGNWTYQEIWG